MTTLQNKSIRLQPDVILVSQILLRHFCEMMDTIVVAFESCILQLFSCIISRYNQLQYVFIVSFL